MSYAFLGDPEFSPEDYSGEAKGLEQYLSNLKKVDKKLKSNYFEGTLLGDIISFFKKKIDKNVYLLPGDFINKETQSMAVKESIKLYKQLKENDETLDDKLKQYKTNLKLTEDSLGTDLGTIYADLLFDKKLIDSPVAGAYTKIFDKLQSFANKNKLHFAFVLGNNDIHYNSFNKRFNQKKYSNINFVDHKIKKINGKLIAGLGGSPETSVILINEAKSIIKDNKTLNDYLSIVSNTSDFEKPAKELLKKAKTVNALLVHKAYNTLDGKLIIGNKRNFKPYDKTFMPLIDKIIKAYNPEYISSGHNHGPDTVKAGNQYYVNPGIRGAVISHLLKDINSEDQIIKPYGELSRDKIETLLDTGEKTQANQELTLKKFKELLKNDDKRRLFAENLAKNNPNIPKKLLNNLIASPEAWNKIMVPASA